jgi:hippurate hydrolase
MPHLGYDPILATSHLVCALQTIVSRSVRPIDAAVLSVTTIQGGQAINAIPERCSIQGTVRTFSIEVLDLIESRLHDIAHSVAASFQCTAAVQFERNYPPTINHSEAADRVRKAAKCALGDQRVCEQEPTMGAEDFSYMLQKKTGCYFFLGNGQGEHRQLGHGLGPCMLHNPSYDFNDHLIETGALLWATLVEQELPS